MIVAELSMKKMPKSCNECEHYLENYDGDLTCDLLNTICSWHEDKQTWCPLMEISDDSD